MTMPGQDSKLQPTWPYPRRIIPVVVCVGELGWVSWKPTRKAIYESRVDGYGCNKLLLARDLLAVGVDIFLSELASPFV